MDIELTFDDSAIEKIADEGFDPVYGARPLRRAITSQIEDMISEEILLGNLKEGQKAQIDYQDEKFVINIL